ncbi:MAG: NAD(P)H-dependent flavin oxidoreductase [Alphaproteobacteria bacterium]
MKALNPVLISGKEILPLIEGGKGINVSDGVSTGAWANAGGAGTFSAVTCDCYDENGEWLPEKYYKKTRKERQDELVEYSIKGGITQAHIAHEMSNGNGRVHMNILWEIGGCDATLKGILEGTKGILHGITCGAGMPYKLAEITSSYGVYYYPIVSSARAFNALWKRAYHKFPEFLGGVVYEDPWCAGGHNGLSNSENPREPQPPYSRVVALRKAMIDVGLKDTPIIVAGGVWWLEEWEDWLDNPEIGKVVFQFGTRPLLTQESPITDNWKQKLLDLKKGDVLLQKFSPTGFYSSAVKTRFLNNLERRKQAEIEYSLEASDTKNTSVTTRSNNTVYVSEAEAAQIKSYETDGLTVVRRTPDNTLVFLTKDEDDRFKKEISECIGCLSACNYSAWSERDNGSTGKIPDPRSFCIHKTLIDISHGGDVEDNIMFAGHNAYRFGLDPFYNDGFIPTVAELIERIKTGK